MSLPSLVHPSSRPPTSRPTTRVLVWGPEQGTRADLEASLRRWRAKGWQVERCEPRVVDGPAYGALVVLRWAPDHDRRVERPPSVDTPFSHVKRRLSTTTPAD